MRITKYKQSIVMELSIDDNLPSELPFEVTNIRAEVASLDLEKREILERHNFCFVDRTVKVTIQLGKLNEKILRMSRFDSELRSYQPVWSSHLQ